MVLIERRCIACAVMAVTWLHRVRARDVSIVCYGWRVLVLVLTGCIGARVRRQQVPCRSRASSSTLSAVGLEDAQVQVRPRLPSANLTIFVSRYFIVLASRMA
jgi:hypothetical protein